MTAIFVPVLLFPTFCRNPVGRRLRLFVVAGVIFIELFNRTHLIWSEPGIDLVLSGASLLLEFRSNSVKYNRTHDTDTH